MRPRLFDPRYRVNSFSFQIDNVARVKWRNRALFKWLALKWGSIARVLGGKPQSPQRSVQIFRRSWFPPALFLNERLRKPMRWVTCIAAPILLADVGDHCFGVFSLDLKRGDERIFGVHGDVVRLPFQFKPDRELHPHASSSHYFGADIPRCPAHAWPRVANQFYCAVNASSVFREVVGQTERGGK